MSKVNEGYKKKGGVNPGPTTPRPEPVVGQDLPCSDVEDCEYLEYELEEDGNSYYFCKIAPAGTDERCENFPNCIYRKYLQEKQDKETLLRTVQILAKEKSTLCKDDTCDYKGLDCLRYNNCEECTKDRTILEQENIRGINEEFN